MFDSKNNSTRIDSRFAANFGILVLCLSFLIGSTSYAYTIVTKGGGGYQTGDWLINYHGGFVRRGFFGSFLMGVFHDSRIEIWSLYLIQTSLYFIVFGFFILHLYRNKSNWFLTILICSPAGIAFSGWDIKAFGRKEVIGYVVLILLMFRISRRKNAIISLILLLVTFLVYVIGIFSWEPLVLFVPSVILLVAKGFNDSYSQGKKYFVYFIFISTSALGLFLSMKNRGTPSQVIMICASIRNAGLDGSELCSGAVDAIGWTSEFTFEKVQSSFPLYFWYLPLTIVALFPIFYAKVLVTSKKIAVVSFLFLLPLYFVVNDYGRWFSMYFISLLIVLIATNRLPSDSSIFFSSPRFGIPYLTTWGLPHFADPNSAFPIVGAIATPLRILFHFFKATS